MSKVNNKNTEHISYLFVVFLLLALNKEMLTGKWCAAWDILKCFLTAQVRLALG